MDLGEGVDVVPFGRGKVGQGNGRGLVADFNDVVTLGVYSVFGRLPVDLELRNTKGHADHFKCGCGVEVGLE